VKAEVIAVFFPEDEPRNPSTATVLLRNSDGQMSLQSVSRDSALGREALRTGCFRRGKAIIDPVSRQMLGYEMERVPVPAA
jgi:hypothetical protein